ncbi:MAG: VOC family protein [Vicinamibacterales bacterium]
MSLQAIGQIAVTARDLARATSFYRDTLGIPHLFTAGTMAFFDCGPVRLLVGLADRPEFEPPGSVLYFRTPDIAAAHADLAAKGVAFEAEPHLVARMPDHELWLAFFRDTEGNLLALMSEVRS